MDVVVIVLVLGGDAVDGDQVKGLQGLMVDGATGARLDGTVIVQLMCNIKKTGLEMESERGFSSTVICLLKASFMSKCSQCNCSETDSTYNPDIMHL